MDNECFKCGASGDKVRLYNAISNKGIVKACDECISVEKIPIIKKPTNMQIEESQKHISVRDRLSGMNKRLIKRDKEVTLRELIDKRFKDRKDKLPEDLIDNFHWTIQRIRRAKKISRDKFAKDIGETEEAIKMIENGFLPEEDYRLIKKIEDYLKVSLRKPGTSEFPATEPPKKFILDNSLIEDEDLKELSFENEKVKQLKISDLRKMKKKHEEEILNEPLDSWEEEYSQDDEMFFDENFEDDY